MPIKIDYVEFDTADMAASKNFLASAFGWHFADYGPNYQAFENAGLDGGLDASGGQPGKALVILKTDDLEAALAAVTEAGGEIVKPIFDFPGGRRFHFREPGGNELAVWSER